MTQLTIMAEYLLYVLRRSGARTSPPVLRPQLFTSGGFTAAAVAAVAVLFTVVGIVFVFSLLFAHQHISDLGIAIRLGHAG